MLTGSLAQKKSGRSLCEISFEISGSRGHGVLVVHGTNMCRGRLVRGTRAMKIGNRMVQAMGNYFQPVPSRSCNISVSACVRFNSLLSQVNFCSLFQ